MKFLCDRCKTRYSIGDDRVRGKILKIRCKNCANVITVREGMSDAEVSDPNNASQRRNLRPTTAAPPVAHTAPASNGAGALGAAFASAMTTKPPPALDEEWYVSIDGEQAGPYSLSEAQRWVASQGYDAELHCWSEGFDDWLPVDKVSHFRGLRKKPAPPVQAAPPPLPRLGTDYARAAAVARAERPEETPKPLFAATMASLEKSVAPVGPLGIPRVMEPIPATTLRGHGSIAPTPSATPPGGTPAIPHTNGKPALPSVTRPVPGRPTTKPGVGSRSVPGFDHSEPGGSATQLESPPFEDENVRTTAEPVHAAVRAFDAARGANGAALRPAPEPAYDDSAPSDELDIGEVSRVVKLADITRTPRRDPTQQVPRRSGPIPGANRTGMIGRVTASTPKLADITGAVPAISQSEVAPLGGPEVAPDAAFVPPVAVTHRRGLFALIGVAAALLVGVIGLVVYFVYYANGDDDSNDKLGRVQEFNPERPDVPDVRRPVMVPGTNIEIPQTPKPPPRQHVYVPPRNPPNKGSNDEVPETPGGKLQADEVEAMARKQSQSTNFCYTRALRGRGAIELADLKTLWVSLTVDKDGLVTASKLDEHNADELGNCINRAIHSWKFRQSNGGDFRFKLQFVNI